MAETFEIVVIGGGPAGTAAAITAARGGARVLLLERGQLPRQKVCGEFLSAEGVQTLQELAPEAAQNLLATAPRIARSRIFVDEACVELPIEPEAASITRYDLDLALWQAAAAAGADSRQQTTVTAIDPRDDGFAVTLAAEGGRATHVVSAQTVIDASGRWSRLRTSAGETPARQPARGPRYIGLKAHYRTAEVGRPTVDLYFFGGGYCGVQPVGDGLVNACAMVRPQVASTLDEVFGSHRALAERSRGWQPAGEAIATSPLIFEDPQPVRGSVLCAGDAAGFVDPFVGDGITLALRGGRLAAQAAMRHDAPWYAREYRARLQPVFGNASWLRRVMELPAAVRRPIVLTLRAPFVARAVVRATRAR